MTTTTEFRFTDMDMNTTIAEELFPAVTVESYTSEGAWLEGRRKGLGASEIAAVLGYSTWTTPLQIWAAKTGRDLTPQVETEAMYWGKAQEPALAARYVRDTQRGVTDLGRTTLLRSRRHPWLTATLDRVILRASSKAVPVPLELKTAHWLRREDWTEEPPTQYQMQVQAQIAITESPWAALCVLIGNEHFTHMDIDRHETFIARMIEETGRWWRDHVLADVPPPPGPSRGDRSILKAIYPETGGLVDLPPEVVQWDERLLALKDEIKRLNDEKDGIENRLTALIGQHTVGIVPGTLLSYSLTTVHKTAYTVAAHSYRQLRRKLVSTGRRSQ